MNPKFIEIPIVVKENENEVDYEGLGIEEPEPETDVIQALVNINNIGRINAIEDEELYKTVLFAVDEEQPVFRTPLSYEEVKNRISSAC